jgi:hypothetical protein
METMTTQPTHLQLAEFLRFDPGWIKDPVPWLLPYLDKSAILEVARIHTEFQKAVLAAHSKALDQFQGVLQKQAAGK